MSSIAEASRGTTRPDDGGRLSAMGARDEDFTTFVSTLWPRLSRMAMLLTRCDADADEALSLALERTYLKWRQVRRADNPEAYCIGILVRAASDNRRRGWRSRTTLTDDATLDRTSAAPDLAAVSTDRVALHAALRSLPERQRMAVALRYLEDLPVAAVAEVMGVTDGTVKRACSDGLRTLRARMEGDDD